VITAAGNDQDGRPTQDGQLNRRDQDRCGYNQSRRRWKALQAGRKESRREM